MCTTWAIRNSSWPGNSDSATASAAPIDIAYAARKVFPDRQIYLIGDIIHNPEVNRQLEGKGIKKLPWKPSGRLL